MINFRVPCEVVFGVRSLQNNFACVGNVAMADPMNHRHSLLVLHHRDLWVIMAKNCEVVLSTRGDVEKRPIVFVA
jgi:hypothetical protein